VQFHNVPRRLESGTTATNTFAFPIAFSVTITIPSSDERNHQ